MHTNVSIFVSTTNDGTMRLTDDMPRDDEKIVIENRRRFLEKHGVQPEQTVRVQLDYQSKDFCRYSTVAQQAGGEGIIRNGRIADGVATRQKNLALFLPLADCVGAVLYDPRHEVLMLSHLGRHNLEQNGGQKSVEYMAEQFGTLPQDIEVWCSPAAGRANYPLLAFDNKSLAEVAQDQLIAAGVQSENIELSLIDTTAHSDYFSHSQFLKGNQSIDGRFAVVAMMK